MKTSEALKQVEKACHEFAKGPMRATVTVDTDSVVLEDVQSHAKVHVFIDRTHPGHPRLGVRLSAQYSEPLGLAATTIYVINRHHEFARCLKAMTPLLEP